MPNQMMPMFSATFWDKSVRIFEVTQTPNGPFILQKASTNINTVPLCSCWNADCSALYVGCMDGTIKIIDLNTMNASEIGRHSASVSHLHYIPQQSILISNGYENRINFWQGGPNPAMTVDVMNKVFVTDYKNGVLCGGTANEMIFFLEMATVSSGAKTIVDSAELGKFSQIESIALDAKAETIGLGTVDGRANISKVVRVSGKQGSFQMNNLITFKSNKLEEAGSVILFPINSVDFNPMYENWFLSAGSDGVINFWDFKQRQRIKQFSYGSKPVCCTSISANGSWIAYATGNDWHIGQEGVGKWQNRIGIHVITEQETKHPGAVKKS
jgi:WD40 repeat protein